MKSTLPTITMQSLTMTIEKLRVVAFDPGGTTGLVKYQVALNYKHDPALVEADVYKFSQLGPHKHHVELDKLLADFEPHIVIYERFDYRNRARPGLSMMSRDYIGVIDLYCARNGIVPVQQMPAHAKGFVKDSNIRKLGLWEAGSPHAMDACRHLLYWRIHKSGIDSRELLEKGWK